MNRLQRSTRHRSGILVVEPDLKGHKPFFLAMIVRALQEHHAVELLSPDWTPDLIAHFERQQVRTDSIAKIRIDSERPVLEQIRELTKQTDYQHIFVTYLDSLMVELSKLDKPLPTNVCGIWFHPYALDKRYAWLPPLDKRLRVRRAIHRQIANPEFTQQMGHLFVLTSGALRALKALAPNLSVSLLPDPAEGTPTLNQQDARAHFGLPQDKEIYLHVGTSDPRKGLTDTITAFTQRANNGDALANRHLLRVGKNSELSTTDKDRLKKLCDLGVATVIDHYVKSEDFLNYFSAADWVLLPYRKFRYSSGILANARMAGRPVISSNYGHIGETVRSKNLGAVYKHGDSKALYRAIVESNADDFKKTLEDPRTADELSQSTFIRSITHVLDSN